MAAPASAYISSKPNNQETQRQGFIEKVGVMGHFRVVSKLGYRDPVTGLMAGRKLGKGSFATVFEARSGSGLNSPRVIKTFRPRASDSSYDVEKRFSERTIGVPHIVQLRSGTNCELAFDLIPGWDIYKKYYTTDASLLTPEILHLLYQALHTLNDLQEKNLAHADIKPENAFWERSLSLFTLFDFNLGLDFGDSKEPKWMKARGTPNYCAPEMFFEIPYHSSIDTWSLAILILELYLDRKTNSIQPILPEHSGLQKLQTFVSLIGLPPPGWVRTSDGLKQYLKLNDAGAVEWIDPLHAPQKVDWVQEIRETGKKLKDPEFVTESLIQLIGEMLRYENRASPKDILTNPIFNNFMDFTILSKPNLPELWTLALYRPDGKRVAAYPLRQRIYDTNLSLLKHPTQKSVELIYGLFVSTVDGEIEHSVGKIVIGPKSQIEVEFGEEVTVHVNPGTTP